MPPSYPTPRQATADELARLRRAMEIAGIGTRRLAAKAAVSRKSVQRVLAGMPVSVRTLARVTHALGVEVAVPPEGKTPGKRLRSYRERQGLTQRELANRTGITDDHLSRLERDYCSPGRWTLAALANQLGINVRELDPDFTDAPLLVSSDGDDVRKWKFVPVSERIVGVHHKRPRPRWPRDPAAGG